MRKVLIFLLIISSSTLIAQDFVWHLDTAEARQRVFEADEYRQPAKEGYLLQTRGTGSVQYYTSTWNSIPIIVFATKQNGKFHESNPGTVIFHMNQIASQIESISFVLPNKVLLKFESFGQRTRMFSLFKGRQLLSPQLFPLSLEDISVLPLAQVLSLGRWDISWERLLVPPSFSNYKEVFRISSEIREYLPNLPDNEDGAMDQFGNLVFIETKGLQAGNPGFNCSGFAKWIADGLYFQRYQQFLAIDELKAKSPDLRGSELELQYDDERDPFFGLDWTRNIAWVLNHRWGSKEEYDVRRVGDFEYTEDRGYDLRDLETIMFLVSLENRETIYFASINKDFGSNPVLNQHIHVVVLFPYFTVTGEFQFAIFERNVESGFKNLQSRYKNAYIHLTKVSAEDGFQIISLE